MPFKPGQGGRKPGARNRITRVIKDIWIELGGEQGEAYAKQLHALACGQHADPQVRVKALSIIAPYVWKKQVERTELEVSGHPTRPLTVVHEHVSS